MSDRSRLLSLVLWPAVITLAVTLLRLAGELLHWSPTFFSREAGGAGAIIGIVWLVPVFGAYFAWKLVGAGEGPASIARAALLPLISIAPVVLAGAVTQGRGFALAIAAFAAASFLSMWIACQGWPALGRVLLAYALAARIPVALVMLVAIFGNWGTHYDVAPPTPIPATGALGKWVLIGLIPQMTVWIAFTMAVGGLVGALTAAVARLRGAGEVRSAA